jgi:transposase
LGNTTRPATWYRFTTDRTGAHPQAHLTGFRGLLQADAYAGYDALYRSGVTEVGCWAHFRRKVFDLHERVATPLTTDILERIGALYGIEAEVRSRPRDVRLAARQNRTRPLVVALREPLDTALRRLSPKSDMAKAIAYGTKRWPALRRFLDDGHLEIDNNIAERALRRVAVGRRNWLFAGSKTGGERSAAIYTVIQTCKANGVDPQAYVADVIGKIAADWPATRWDELMPWNWAAQTVEPVAQAAQFAVCSPRLPLSGE